MDSTELQEIKDYWTKKYPHVAITLYPKYDDSKYRGKMMTHNESFDLQADTIGELISQGESFLRKVKQ
jgi:hypothetical protein